MINDLLVKAGLFVVGYVLGGLTWDKIIGKWFK